MGTHRVLIAEDDPEMLEAVASAVERHGARVVRGESGADLVQQLAHAPFDLVITDVSMPWMNGLQALQSARAAGTTTPVIVISGLRSPSLLRQVAALGANARLLQKPFELADLHAAIVALLPRQPT